jgi:ferredoxin
MKTGNQFARVAAICLVWGSWTISVAAETASETTGLDYERARWHPLHFKPAIETATNQQCLECHQEILDSKVKPQSPAGVTTANTLAWYQTLDIYAGEQETFHSRHLVTPLAKELMNLQCNTCHEGNDPREEAPIPPTNEDAGFTLRKMVNPETTCLKCHGKHPYEIMGLPGTWEETRESMGNSCLTCHVAIRTNRHQVTYLNAEAIETAAEKNPDVCFGCHGGRKWYRIAYPYSRHPWPGQAEEVPDWAKDRPTESEPRFQLKQTADNSTANPSSTTK